MHRAALLLLLVLAGCNRDQGALQAVIQFDPEVRASCISLDLLKTDGTVLQSQQLMRPSDRTELRVAVFRGTLPQDIQLQARALWGSGCEGALLFNGQSAPVSSRFEPGEVRQVSLDLQRPPASMDMDRDGFIAQRWGGPDCDDDREERRPGADVQEMCDGSDDLNCDGKRGCDDATCSARSCERMPASLSFISVAQEPIAGQCSRPVILERVDAVGIATKPGFATPLRLGTTLPQGVTFHSDAACTSTPFTPAIAAGSSQVTFYVRGTTSGGGQLTAASTGLNPAALSHGILAGPGTRPVFTTPSRTSRAGECTPAISFEWRDAFGNLALGKPKSLSLSTTTNAVLYQDAACQMALPLPANTAEASSFSVYLRGTVPGTAEVVAVGGTDITERQVQTVNPGEAKKLEFFNPSVQTLLAGECSSPVTVRVLDEFGNQTALSTDSSIALSSNLGGFGFYPESGCTGADSSTLSLPAGAKEARFRFKGKTGGNVTITAALSTLTPATQAHEIIPAVRRGSCTLAKNQKTKTCPITPQLRDLTKSFLVFQATTTTDNPNDSFVHCKLERTQVSCGRVGTQEDANIQWQVVELASGLRVQHLVSGCTGLTTSVKFNAVDMNKSFVLYSSSQIGTKTGSNDFAGVQLVSPTQVDIVLNYDCNEHTYVVQVVEFEGATVSRDNKGPMTTSEMSATGLEPEQETARTVLLSTLQTTVETDADICNRMVRAEISTVNSVAFTRGADATNCANADVARIHWERISFPAGTRVQSKVLTVGDKNKIATATLDTPVDATRTLLLSSSQINGGQANGETSYRAKDIPGVAAGRLTLTPSGQLQVERDADLAQARWTSYAIQLEP
ncbi:putative metal-binding motif-containing protein [Melittangium boletus]|nr:putative metal-binding motif-containing protein [Melittangium boletus]